MEACDMCAQIVPSPSVTIAVLVVIGECVKGKENTLSALSLAVGRYIIAKISFKCTWHLTFVDHLKLLTLQGMF